jgi:hypothetical protein
VINIGVVYGIVVIDNWFLLSPVYVLVFGIAVPVLVLITLWLLTFKTGEGPKSLILSGLATAAILLSGGLHFFISHIAALSV